MMRTKTGFVSNIVIATAVWTVPAFAQQGPQQAPQYQLAQNQPFQDQNNDPSVQQGLAPDQQDPEDRNHGVARISLLNGDVTVRRGDSADQVAAAVNAPLLVQDAVITGPASRAELQFDTANRVRFASDTEARISQLTVNQFQLQIARGTLTWAVLGRGTQQLAQAEIATPSVAARLLGPGNYRISVLPDNTTQITVRYGNLDVSTPRGIEHLSAGQTMLARGTSDNPEFQIVAALARDEWDTFNERRDQELQQSQSYNYVSRDIAGAEELDNYGQWNSDPTYGQVWTPRVAADWAPYRLGRWGYEDYYGWTWISSDPWGWAPYHYGNWFRGSYGWSWYPGHRYDHYYYRPALVAFFGFGGGGVGFGGFGFGNVGWVPLAPFERYNRWYGRGFGGGYGRGYGSGNGGFGRTVIANSNITNLYRNARFTNGVTSVSTRDFSSGNFGRFSSPSVSQLQQAGAVRGQMPFTPTANHLRFNDRQPVIQGRSNFGQTNFAGSRITSSGFGRQTSTYGQGSTTQPNQHQGFATFGRQGQSGGQPSGGQLSGQFSNRPASGFGRQNGAIPASSAPSNSSGSNWQQFGSPNRQNFQQAPQGGSFSNRPPQAQANGSQPTWQRFGSPSGSSSQSRTNSQTNFASGRQSSFSAPSPVRVAPPVVQQRQQNFGQPNQSRAYQQPSYQPQQYSRPQQPASRPQQNFSRPQQSYSQPTRQQSYSQPSHQSAPARESSHSSGNSHDSGSHSHR